MTISEFNISVKEVGILLKDFGLLRSKGVKCVNSDGVSESFKANSNKDNYYEAYLEGLKNYDYDFLLEDQSYFQFQFCKNSSFFDIRYAFYQNPINYVSYSEFVKQQTELLGFSDEDGLLDSVLAEEYDQFLSEQDFKSNYTTMRYDADINLYHPLVHSVSHLHIGHNNNIRIPINKTIMPLKFALFTIKHVYYQKWHDKIHSDQPAILSRLKSSRTGEIDLSGDMWDGIEELEIHLK